MGSGKKKDKQKCDNRVSKKFRFVSILSTLYNSTVIGFEGYTYYVFLSTHKQVFPH